MGKQLTYYFICLENEHVPNLWACLSNFQESNLWVIWLSFITIGSSIFQRQRYTKQQAHERMLNWPLTCPWMKSFTFMYQWLGTGENIGSTSIEGKFQGFAVSLPYRSKVSYSAVCEDTQQFVSFFLCTESVVLKRCRTSLQTGKYVFPGADVLWYTSRAFPRCVSCLNAPRSYSRSHPQVGDRERFHFCVRSLELSWRRPLFSNGGIF